MDKQTFFSLLDKYREGPASQAEQELIEAYYRRLEKAGQTELSPNEQAVLKDAIYSRVLTGIKEPPARTVPLKQITTTRLAAAAAILLIACAGTYFMFFNSNPTKQVTQTVEAVRPAVADYPPGRNAAVLTLADGKTIVLDSSNGTISKQGGCTVINMKGLLSYESGKSAEPVFNTVTTARGNQYQLVLADGSKVWLNSASSLRFPTVFAGSTREVELNGEGYFEVAKNPAQRFIVKMNGAQVEVLGTHFNVNCYSDEEEIKTTLLEGSVRILNAVLKPGQQAVSNNDKLIVRDNVDIDQVMAWKNGWFEFDKTDLKTIMRQISRWYDVDVEYLKTPGHEKYGGRIGRNENLSNILNALKGQDVHCRLEGKKLIVE